MTPEASQAGTGWTNLPELLSVKVDRVSVHQKQKTRSFPASDSQLPKGCFARTKHSSHPTVDHMKRYLNPHDIRY